ncbi:MAG: AraC family transcriptional regulator, partial [Xanthomarina gelatinilytica]|nr:AraC family transcriptional regulator [Xanthomarina gelatinilytica]
LIKNTDMNISEVVYTIGLTSRSYFSKIFKEKYNCSPKDYKFAQRSMAISA